MLVAGLDILAKYLSKATGSSAVATEMISVQRFAPRTKALAVCVDSFMVLSLRFGGEVRPIVGFDVPPWSAIHPVLAFGLVARADCLPIALKAAHARGVTLDSIHFVHLISDPHVGDMP